MVIIVMFEAMSSNPQDAELKQERRREYDIGWQPERVPHALGLAGKVLSLVYQNVHIDKAK